MEDYKDSRIWKTEKVEVSGKYNVEQECMKGTKKKYNVRAVTANGTAEPIIKIKEYIQLYLDQLRAVNGLILQPAKLVSFTQYLKEVKCLREHTSSGPSEITPAMVKIEALDPEMARVGWLASNFIWCSGYSSK
eukprot:5523308-Ditylum_brightwellii.AAC.1